MQVGEMKGSSQARQGGPTVLSLTAGVADPEGGMGPHLTTSAAVWAATKSGGEAYHNSGMHCNTNLGGKGTQPPKVASAPVLSLFMFRPEVSLRGRARVCVLPSVHRALSVSSPPWV